MQTRVMKLLQSELANVQPTKLCAQAIGALIPQLCGSYLRTSVWRAAGLPLGRRARVMGPLTITGAGDFRRLISIGDDTFLTGPLRIDLDAPLRIGKRVRIGHDVLLLTIDHEIGPAHARCAENISAPIEIGDGAWLASRCVVLPGVTIGAGSVVAAGAVVTHDVAPDTLVGGVPARQIRVLDEREPRSQRMRGMKVADL